MNSITGKLRAFAGTLPIIAGGLAWTSTCSQASSVEINEIVLPMVVPESTVIDGSLTEPFWTRGAGIDEFVEVLPREGVRPPVNTRVWLLHDGESIYIGFVCYEQNISRVRATLGDKDHLDNDDYVGLLLDTFDQLQSAYKFALNPCGVQVDGIFYPWGETDLTFDTQWEGKARVLTDRWEAEIKIPFSSIDFPAKDEQHWRLYLGRTRPRKSVEEYAWPSISLDKSVFSQLGHLYVTSKISWQGAMEFLPSMVVFQGRSLIEEESSRDIRNQPLVVKTGVTGEYAPRSDLNFDWAINPDYAQMETDAPQLDVNTTFALFYADKRPIFMKGSDIFECPVDVVYTRSMNDPAFVLKFTSRLGNTSLGHIISYDKHTPWIVPFRQYSFALKSERTSLSNIVRIRQSVGEDSYIGGLATSRELSNGFSRVAGVDGSVEFLKNCVLNFQLLKSWYKEPLDAKLFSGYHQLKFSKHTSAFDGERFDGLAYTINLSRCARMLNFGFSTTAFSPTFRADNGFVNKNDYIDIGGWTSLRFVINNGAFESVVPQINVLRRTDYAGSFWKDHVCSALAVSFIRQTYLDLFCTLSREVHQEIEFSSVWTVDARLSTDFSKVLSGGIRCEFGKLIDYCALPPALGSVNNSGLWFSLRPTTQFGLGLDAERYWLWDSNSKEVYDVT
ncbi:MAG: carbohydrate binding family 9 domain-containing protein, partial [Candidatus Thorarchaeota archaeon SMTZ1-83]